LKEPFTDWIENFFSSFGFYRDSFITDILGSVRAAI